MSFLLNLICNMC